MTNLETIKKETEWESDITYSTYEIFIYELLPEIINNALSLKEKECTFNFYFENNSINEKKLTGSIALNHNIIGNGINLKEFLEYLQNIPATEFSIKSHFKFIKITTNISDLITFYYEELQRLEYQKFQNKNTNIINFYEMYSKLGNIIRTGWIIREIPAERLESVLEHTCKVTMLSSLIIHELNLTDINLCKLLDMSLIHDLGEIKVGDIPSPKIKSKKDAKEKHEAEFNAIKSILNFLSPETKNYYLTLWLDFEGLKSKESIILKQIDKLDAILQANLYETEYHISDLFDEFYRYNPNNFLNNNPLGEFYESLPENIKKK